MLTIVVPGSERFDERKGEFVYGKETVLRLEHSLLSLSKWESKWHVPFLSGQTAMTRRMKLDYARCMTVTQNVPDEVYLRLTKANWQAIDTYISDPMTATWFRGEPRPNDPQRNEKMAKAKHPPKKGSEVTAEVLYSQMFALGIPLEWEKRHLNQLLTLIRVCSERQNPPKKMSRKEVLARQREINRQRRGKPSPSRSA